VTIKVSQSYRIPQLAALLLLFILTIGGCVNLDDVAGLTKLGDSAQRTLPTVVADIPASCQRQDSLLNDIPIPERRLTTVRPRRAAATSNDAPENPERRK
jgi:hypothetical protein